MSLIMLEVIMATQVKWKPNYSQQIILLGWNKQNNNIEPPIASGRLENTDNKLLLCMLVTLFTAVVIHYHRYQKEQPFNCYIKKTLKTA